MPLSDTGVTVTDGHPSEMLLVAANNKQQFLNWCFKNHIQPTSKTVKFVWRGSQLVGYRDAWLIDLVLNTRILTNREFYLMSEQMLESKQLKGHVFG